MTDQEKKEVLALWSSWSKNPATGFWHSPRGYVNDIDPDGPPGMLPDFLHSLDALGKWCIPDIEHLFEIEWMPQIGGWSCRITTSTGTGYKPFYGRGTTMAEATAAAVLSLIGEQVPA